MPDNIWIGDCPAKGPSECAPEYASLWEGLVGLWAPALGPTGNALFDLSGRNNHGTMQNMDPATAWVGSPGGWALDLDGTDDYVDITMPTWTGSHVLAVWFHVSVSPDSNSGVFCSDYTKGSRSRIYTDSTSSVAALGQRNARFGATPISVGELYVCVKACLNNGTAESFWVNGILRGTATATSANYQNLGIGTAFFGDYNRLTVLSAAMWLGEVGTDWIPQFSSDPFGLLRPAGFGAELWYPGGTPPVSSIPAIYDYYRRLRCA